MTGYDPFFFMAENVRSRQIGLADAKIRYRTLSFDASYYRRARGVAFPTDEAAYLDWLRDGRRLGLEYAPGRHTLLKIILKAKDEPELLDAWLRHHASIVGYENLIVMDCGSTDETYLSILRNYENRVLILDYRKYYDALHGTRGNVKFYGMIAANCRYVAVLDADEFMLRYDDGEFSADVCGLLRETDEIIHAGTWLWNDGSVSTHDDGRLDLSQPITFSASAQALLSGTYSGKTMARASHLMEIEHLGHNMHVPAVVRAMSANSVGKIFILHIRSMPSAVVKRRMAKHLVSKKVLPAGIRDPEEIRLYLLDVLEKAELPAPSLAYARKYVAEADKVAETRPQDKYSINLDTFAFVDRDGSFPETLKQADLVSYWSRHLASLTGGATP